MQNKQDSDKDEGATPEVEEGTIVDEGPSGPPIEEELGAQQDEADRESPHSASELVRALEDQKDRYLRLAAEFENFRRRTNKERLELGARAQADLATSLLDSLDDLTRFSEVDPEAVDAKSIYTAVELVSRKLSKALTSAGLEKVEPLGEAFDPSMHEAVSTAPAESEKDDNIIAAVFQPGYLYKGQLLRPARVVVKAWNN